MRKRNLNCILYINKISSLLEREFNQIYCEQLFKELVRKKGEKFGL